MWLLLTVGILAAGIIAFCRSDNCYGVFSSAGAGAPKCHTREEVEMTMRAAVRDSSDEEDVQNITDDEIDVNEERERRAEADNGYEESEQ